jgi:dTDP-4-amino-4,6-dideoxygalactose transaminase
MKNDVSRRGFLAATAVGAAFAAGEKPAALGGPKIHTGKWPSWPVIDKTEEDAMLGVLNSRHWYRGGGKAVDAFEEAYAKLTGAKACLATANGTSALLTSLAALGIGPGDEVILPPYTFVATVNVVLMLNAMPVFVDSDRETMQIDPKKIEAAITPRTTLILPVHIGGSAADLDSILAIGKKRSIPVIEDACQAHLGEWRGKKLGTLGKAGCFSFQASKNLNSGEGGAILSNDPDFIEKCYAFHNNSRGRKAGGYDFRYMARGLNLRMTEFQAKLLLAQMTRLEKQSARRDQNAAYLTSMLREIPGIMPARLYEGNTRSAYHLYMFRYDKDKFAGLPRAKFLKAMSSEGVPCSGGYSPLNKEEYIKETIASKGYQRIFPKDEIARWERRTECPENDKLCTEAVWFTQTMLLAERADMEHIAAAIKKIQAWAPDLAKA